MKPLLLGTLFTSFLLAHPVSYTIDLTATFDDKKKEVLITCQSNSRNKCGLHNIKLWDSNKRLLAKGRFPFLKKHVIIKSDEKPERMEFYLRNIPEHNYIIYLP